MTDARPFWRQLGIDYLGMRDPQAEVRRERAKRVTELQAVIARAAQFESLQNAPGYVALVNRWQQMQADLTRLLISAKPDEFVVLQARLKAFEEAVNIVPDAIREANEARREVEQLTEDE